MITALSTLRTQTPSPSQIKGAYVLIGLILFFILRDLYLHHHEKSDLEKLAATEREISGEEVRGR